MALFLSRSAMLERNLSVHKRRRPTRRHSVKINAHRKDHTVYTIGWLTDFSFFKTNFDTSQGNHLVRWRQTRLLWVKMAKNADFRPINRDYFGNDRR